MLKLPPKLVLQVWDNDKFSADDFLGEASPLLPAATGTLWGPQVGSEGYSQDREGCRSGLGLVPRALILVAIDCPWLGREATTPIATSTPSPHPPLPPQGPWSCR